MRKILCYGDSNTYGFDPRDGGRYPEASRWPDILSTLTGVETVNEGLNGRTIPFAPRGFDLLRQMLARHRDCDTLFIMLGTNDIFHIWEPNAQKVTARMRGLLENVPELQTFVGGRRTLILLAPPPLLLPPIPENEAYLETARNLSENYQMLAKDLGVPFFDVAALNPAMAYDGVHLSEQGHRQLAWALAAKLPSQVTE